MRLVGPTNYGVSFANLDGNIDDEHVLNSKTQCTNIKDKLHVTCQLDVVKRDDMPTNARTRKLKR
jgi:hypothetical protein